MKQFHQCLEERGLLSIPYKGALSISVVRRARLLPALSQEELALILKQVDRASDMGKRDYAIILLGATAGLRAVDIVNMKLRDIHWRSGEIHVIQQKTGETLSLPLMPQVGEAVKEYILCGRPESDSEYLFLRRRAPFQKMHGGVPIGDMFDSYQKKTGIARKPCDGKGFHSLRRLLGREMTVAEIPVATIAQVLGHGKADSATQCISLDSEHLKACALDLREIEVGRSDLLA
jgi:integrase